MVNYSQIRDKAGANLDDRIREEGPRYPAGSFNRGSVTSPQSLRN